MNPFVNVSYFMKAQRLLDELYTKAITEAAAEYGLSKREAEVLVFFANNREYTSAVDAVRVRGFSKTYVSIALERLVSKELITLTRDGEDRRVQHIAINASAQACVLALQKMQGDFVEAILAGYSEEEKETLKRLFRKMAEHAETIADEALNHKT